MKSLLPFGKSSIQSLQPYPKSVVHACACIYFLISTQISVYGQLGQLCKQNLLSVKQAYIMQLLITSSFTTFPMVYIKTVQKGKAVDWSAFNPNNNQRIPNTDNHWTHKQGQRVRRRKGESKDAKSKF